MTVATLVQSWTRASERIDERAKTIKFRQVALVILSLPFFVVAFVLYFVLIKGLWTVITWLAASCIEGWNTAKAVDKGSGP